MYKNDLGAFLRWLIMRKLVKNKGEFAQLTDINRTYLHSIIKGEGELSDIATGKVLSVFGKEYQQFLGRQVSEETELPMLLEETAHYSACKKCVVKDAEIAKLKSRISELEELVSLYRATSPIKKESKRAV